LIFEVMRALPGFRLAPLLFLRVGWNCEL
jgi:hypothetical protein